MECFIKKIFEGRIDEQVHRQFVRFGKGSYEKRALLSLRKTSKIKVKGSFEYANDFVSLVSEFNARFSGIIISKEKLDLGGEKKKSGLYSYEVSDISSEKIKELKDKVYYFLLDVESPEISLKIKKKLPKPGKSGEGKGNDKFCQLEADLKFYHKIKETFFWDIQDCKKVKAEHDYEITELILPKDEKDLEKIRIMTKRKGIIKRRLEIDKREEIQKKEFIA